MKRCMTESNSDRDLASEPHLLQRRSRRTRGGIWGLNAPTARMAPRGALYGWEAAQPKASLLLAQHRVLGGLLRLEPRE